MESLWARGYSRLGILLDERECEGIRSLYTQPELFRSRIDMARYRFGRGEYQYFNYPLPAKIDALRREWYGQLVGTAREWTAALSRQQEYPDELSCFLEQCAAAGQARPTPLLLRYQAGDFNCLHQDLYGELVFPLQVVILLSDPAHDFTGGEFLLVEQRPRAQSRGEIVPLRQGDAAIFPVHHRPVRGAKGPYRMTMRHGVSRVRSGDRQTLGLIFHDAA
jgi:uncharacterized protein